MSSGVVIAVIWLVVFIIGVVVGVMGIVALSAMRKDHKDEEGEDDPDDRWNDQWLERDHGVSGIAGHWDASPHWPDAPGVKDPGPPEDELTS
jgi:hypothetical protein